MILKKPYAFFIKMFKPIHLMLAAFVFFLLYLTNNILKFLNEYINSIDSLIDKSGLDSLINTNLYIIPVIVMIIFLIILTIMYKKKKPITFYFVGIFIFVVILVINVYSINFLQILNDNVVSVKSVKLIHDLIVINMILESLSFVLLFARGVGIDFKKFDFSSDVLKLEISDKDNEEIEVNVDIDFNERRRKRKEKIRKLKYFYAENRYLVNIGFIVLGVIVSLLIAFIINSKNHINKEGVYYDSNYFTFKINDTKLLNNDFQGKKITDNYLIVVSANIKSKVLNKSLYLSDFSLKVEDIKFKPIKKYFDSLIDLGTFYDEQVLSLENTDYLFVYEIPEKYLESNMYFSYNSEGRVIDILLNPKKIKNTDVSHTKKINEEIYFEGPLIGSKFKINSYEIRDKYLLEYDYCVKDNDCILSREYLKPSLNQNYDKVVLKFDVNYTNESDLDIDSFYKLLSKFGIISYKKGDNWYNIYDFEEILSKRISSKKDVYVGINSDIVDSESIKIIFDVRGLRYEYILK